MYIFICLHWCGMLASTASAFMHMSASSDQASCNGTLGSAYAATKRLTGRGPRRQAPNCAGQHS
eukprot:2715835-Karenia_brevis.AAC.1